MVAAGALLHDVGMSIHRVDHEAYSLFLAERKLRELLADVYKDPAERAVVIAESLHAIIGHRRRGEPYTVEAGVVRVADALDMAHGRTRLPVEAGQMGIHSISAAAIDRVEIAAGTERAVRIEIAMNNSAGIFQVDDLLATKLRGTPLEDHVEVVAEVEGEAEKRLLTEFRIGTPTTVAGLLRPSGHAKLAERVGSDAGALGRRGPRRRRSAPRRAAPVITESRPSSASSARPSANGHPDALDRRAAVGEHRLLRERGEALGDLERALEVARRGRRPRSPAPSRAPRRPRRRGR